MSRPARWAFALSLALTGTVASAHGSVQGLGHFFGGVVHPVLEPAHSMALIAIGLWVGQRGLAASHPVLPSFALGAVAGLLGAGLGASVDAERAVLAGAALAGVMVATGLPLPRAVPAMLAGALALGIGLGSRPEGQAGSALLAALAGTGVGVCVWMLNVASWTQALRRPWLRVVLRVFASWIGAAALLVLSLSFAPRPASPLAQAGFASLAAAAGQGGSAR